MGKKALSSPIPKHLPSRATNTPTPLPVPVAYGVEAGSLPLFDRSVQVALLRNDLIALEKKLEAAMKDMEALTDQVAALTTLRDNLTTLRNDLESILPETGALLLLGETLPGVSTAMARKTHSLVDALSELDIPFPGLQPGDHIPKPHEWYRVVEEDLRKARRAVVRKLGTATDALSDATSKVNSVTSQIKETKSALEAWGVSVP